MVYTWVQKLAESKWMWASCELRLFLDMEVMDGPRPPTTGHRRTASSALKCGVIIQQGALKQCDRLRPKKLQTGSQCKTLRGVRKKRNYSFNIRQHWMRTKNKAHPVDRSVPDRMTKFCNTSLRDVAQTLLSEWRERKNRVCVGEAPRYLGPNSGHKNPLPNPYQLWD